MSCSQEDIRLMARLFTENKLPISEIGNVFWMGVGSVKDYLRVMGIDPNEGKNNKPSVLKLSE